ncbi:MAG: response regulator [Gammaproteobacteria bacterium]|nr:response regulator [Gammaproteobacteria bacterium]MCW8988463.1 response regulator [Gammaproteobacteria bacterium]
MAKDIISMLKENYKFLIAIAFLWSLLLILSFYSNIRGFEKHSIRLATKQANDYWNKDSAFRTWATRHGGFYVQPDKRTPPNPSLAHLPHRDVETKTGIKLTLMNPAYMMRQMTEEFDELYGVKGRITGQVLLDPEGKINKPDTWELESLKKFDRGEKEIIQIAEINHEPYLRMIRPMIMKEGCVLCHGHLGFKVGDIRGGVSVSVPLKPFEQENYSSQSQSLFSHVSLWLMGLIVLIYISIIKNKQVEKDKLAMDIMSRSQKMDALGQLSGGIAHDYNNMLGVILGYAELLENQLTQQPNLTNYVHEIQHAGERGTKLTKKLLTFAKKNYSEEEQLDLNLLLQHQQDMLKKTLTPRISLILNLKENLWPVWLDESDIEDAILNISINAMHSIKGNGQLTIQTGNQRVDQDAAYSLGVMPGDYVLLSFADTGCGMDKVTQAKIFEPFFTTKGSEGTGLGLSQVYGFVNRSKGAIKVYSEPDKGTHLTLYFPRYNTSEKTKSSETVNLLPSSPTDKNILVVDDEIALLNLTCEILSENGFNVFAAENAKQALDILESRNIDALVTDIIMPEMDGYQLAAIVQEKYPAIKIQFISGYTKDVNETMVEDTLQKNLIHKPFSSQELILTIQKLLDKK